MFLHRFTTTQVTFLVRGVRLHHSIMTPLHHKPIFKESNLSVPPWPPEEGYGYLWVDEGEEGLDDAQLDDVVAEVRPVADDVAQGPHRLLAHVLVRRVEELQEEGDGAGGHHGLGLLAGAGGDVGEGPGRLELQAGGVLRGREAARLQAPHLGRRGRKRRRKRRSRKRRRRGGGEEER